MAEIFLLIDGYNLLHAAGMARDRYGPRDLQWARTRLIRWLVRKLTKRELSRTSIVFDARHPPENVPHTWLQSGLHVQFAAPEQEGDADVLIEELISRHSAPRQLVIVSSDHRLQQAAKRRRAAFITSEMFVDQLEERTAIIEEEAAAGKPAEQGPRNPKYTGQPDETDVEFWLAVFGEITPESLAPRGRSPRQPQPPRKPPASPPQSLPEPASPAKKISLEKGNRKSSRSSTKRGDSSVTKKSPPRKETRSTADANPSDPNSSAALPELFGDRWIEELQKWVDEQQKPRRKSEEP